MEEFFKLTFEKQKENIRSRKIPILFIVQIAI